MARAWLRRAKGHRVATFDKAHEPPEQLIGMPGDFDPLHGKLDVDRAADAHDRHVRRADASTEVERGRPSVEPRRGNLRSLRARLYFLIRMRGVVEKRARLDKACHRIGARPCAERHWLVVEMREQRVSALEAKPAVELLEHVAQNRVRFRGRRDLLARAGDRLRRTGVLSHRIYLDARKWRDGLPRRGDDAPNLVHFVSE